MEKCKLCNSEEVKYDYNLKFLGKNTKTIKIGNDCGSILYNTNKYEQTNVVNIYTPDYIKHIEALENFICEENNKCRIKFFYYYDMKKPNKRFASI